MQSANGKYGGPRGESYTKYGEKTSEHGHWEVGDSYAGTNVGGDRWQNQRMEWVEDNRKFEAPEQSAPEPEPEAPPEPYVPSDKVANARESVESFERDTLGSQGDQLFAQDFKDEYADNLVNDIKAQNPAVLDAVKQGIEEKDRLNLGTGLVFS